MRFKSILLISLFLHPFINLTGDSFEFNTYNNHGVVGLVNIPTARFYDESSHGITFYDGTPDQKITLTSSPFNWMEASFFYANLQNRRYCGFEFDEVCNQDYKDKGFNFKIRIKEEDIFPAIALGLNDIAGTGLYSSEYLVASYGINKLDIHFGLGWGTLNGSDNRVKNPFTYISDRFANRPGFTADEDKGGQFEPGRYFSSKDASIFYGLSFSLNENFLLKFERDTTAPREVIFYEMPSSDYSIGVEYLFNQNFTFGLAHERGIYTSFKFTYKNNPKNSVKKYEYKSAKSDLNDNKYTKFVNNLEKNGIGVNKISETTRAIGIELTQFMHPDIALVEEIISSAATDAGINKNIKKDIKIANLTAVKEIDNNFQNQSNLIYEREKTKSLNTSTRIKFRPFLASREEFFKGALLLENDSEFVFKDNLFIITNLKYSLWNNFDDLKYPPVNTYPAQVRSDIKDYLKNMNDKILIGRAQVDYYFLPKQDHYFMLSAGIFEDMFSGYGFEYLYYQQDKNYSIGFELFDVQKRDYNWRFGTLNYKNLTGSINFYYRNYGSIPFDMKISYGEYLAGDVGSTIEFSRSFKNGTKFGVFASFTNVTAEQFGEGTFDKGIFFNIPLYGNFINYTWRPLTKDPGAKLNRRNSLHSLLVKFRPID